MPDTPTAITVETPAPLPTNLGNGIAPNVTSRCGNYYKVDVGDDCATISLKFNVTGKVLVFLNPMLNGNCTNLWISYTYCVQPVGDINIYPSYAAGPIATLPPFTAGPKMSLSWVDPAPTLAPGNIIIPLANDTRVDCHNYMWINGTNSESLDCWSIAEAAGLQCEEFALWNPSIDKNAAGVEDRSYNYDCALHTSMPYCMGIAAPTPYWKATPTARKPPSPRASGEIANCLFWMHVNTQLNCGVMVENFDLPMRSHYCIRTPDIPAIDGDISITPSPTSTTPPIASGTPSPIQDGMISGCTKFYLVVSQDGCWAIANQNSISLDDFYAWNPAVGKNCAILYPNYYVCIVTASTTTSRATTTQVSTISSVTTAKAAAPGPTQSGIPTNCNKWVAQKDGVYCYDMAQGAGMSLDRLYALNPALNDDCSGLWPGYTYCIGTYSSVNVDVWLLSSSCSF